MNVILCDTNEAERQKYRNKLQELSREHHVPLTLEEKSSGRQLLFDIEDNPQGASLIYLEVALPDLGGIETANRLRAMGISADLIFVTHNREQVFRAFDVDAMQYLLKDGITDEKFESVFLKAAQRAAKRDTELISFSCAGEHRQVSVEDIWYFEVKNRIITVHYNQESFEFYSAMSKIEELLYGRGFERIHKSFLVASQYIESVTTENVKLRDGTFLPVGRTYAARSKGA